MSSTSMQAMPTPPTPQAASFQRSGSALKWYQRAASANALNTKFVSGSMSTGAEVPGVRRKKYCTWAPGVSNPSGMILVYSYVRPAGRPCSEGFIPEVRSEVQSGGYATDTGCVPQIRLQATTLVVVLLLQAVPRPSEGSTTKQRFFAEPRIVYFGSAS